jgi:ATP-binding cassette subfamily B protein
VGLLRGIGGITASAWRASPSRMFVSALFMVLSAVSGPLLGLGAKWLTDTALAGDATTIATAAGVLAFGVVGTLSAEHFAHVFFSELADLHAIAIEQELGEITQGAVSLGNQHDSEYADRMELLRNEINAIGDGVQSVLTAGALLINVGITAWLLASVQPALLLLPAFAIPPVVAGRLAQAAQRRAELDNAELTRLGTHLLEQAVSPAIAKEIRVFGLQNELRRRQADLRRRIHRRLVRSEALGLAVRTVSQGIFAGGYMVGILLVVNSAVARERSVGAVVLVITLAVQINAQVAGVVSVAEKLQRSSLSMASVRWLRDFVAETDTAQPTSAAVPARLRHGVLFAGVSFKYPGSERYILRNLWLSIPAGSTVAVVGDNGAGKSTLVKLLARFYEPDFGAVLIDDVDIRHFPVEEWRRRITASFQNAHKFEMAAGEIVGIGDLPHMYDTEAVSRAIGRAMATDVIARLPAGLNSHVGRTYADGAELSGGQWQRLSLGRAMMRQEPLLLVLDEPTSAVDAATEHELFRSHVAAAKAAGQLAGAITMFISHRFSTVAAADLIVVLADGSIAEAGNHTQLMARNGLYAEMFSSQARAYQ